MTHELKYIVQQAVQNQHNGIKSVLATVVHLDGSSYRKPGVRMLLSENGEMTGAVSGGCVEKEVWRRSQSVFETGQAKIMTYDGRYRLGCEGTLYILLELFVVSDAFLQAFSETLDQRCAFSVNCYFERKDEQVGDFGSVIRFKNEQHFTFSKHFDLKKGKEHTVFTQEMVPCFRLLIIGGEHDAVKLCKMAAMLGWEVDVVTSIKDPKALADFPGSKSVVAATPETIDLSHIDAETSVVLMNHNFALDLQYLVKLQKHSLEYVGILGSVKRREQLQNDLVDYAPDVPFEFLDAIHSPAGLNIGAITPEEIALSILSEILAVTRKRNPQSLKTLTQKKSSVR